MDQMQVTVRVDQVAALQAGRMLADQVAIMVSPESLGDAAWQEMIPLLNTRDRSISNIIVAGDSADDLKLALGNHREDRLGQEATRTLALETRLAELVAIDPETTELPEARWQAAYDLDTDEISNDGTITRYQAPTVEAPYYAPAYSNTGDTLEHKALVDQINAKIKALRTDLAPRVAATNHAMYLAAKPELLAKRARDIAAAAEAEKAKAEEIAALRAARLADHEVTWQYGSYNERRYGAPWGARVSLASGKLVYDFSAATVTARWGSAGEVVVPCAVGEIVATGQKDTRNAAHNSNSLYVLREDGELVEVTRTEAVKILNK